MGMAQPYGWPCLFHLFARWARNEAEVVLKLVMSVRGVMESNRNFICVRTDLANAFNSIRRSAILDVLEGGSDHHSTVLCLMLPRRSLAFVSRDSSAPEGATVFSSPTWGRIPVFRVREECWGSARAGECVQGSQVQEGLQGVSRRWIVLVVGGHVSRPTFCRSSPRGRGALHL